MLWLAGPLAAQVATSVTVNAGTPVTYAGSNTAIMPATGIGIHTSVYANSFGNSNLSTMLLNSGVQTLRYPGGSYSDTYKWNTNTGNGGYIVGAANTAHFLQILDQSHTSGMVTVNYGSDVTNTIGGTPEEAAAWVAYANADPAIYGTANDVTLGVDAGGTNWYTAGYWAKLRASTASQYQSWAGANYHSAFSFLAINHPVAAGIRSWEIGNELNGNGYTGTQWEYDLHAPYDGGDSSSNVGRKGNALLSPAAYGGNLIAFADLMKKVDPTIKIGSGFLGGSNDASDKAILAATNAAFPGKHASDYIDFGIIHWYPNGNVTDPVSSLPGLVTTGGGSLPTKINNLRNTINNNTNRGLNGIAIDITEYGFSLAAGPTHSIGYALFAADTYATGLQMGVQNLDYLEMSKPPFLSDPGSGTFTPGEVYYATQMLDKFVNTGDTFITTSTADGKLRAFAVKRPNGSIGLMFLNDGEAADTSDLSQNRTLTITLNGVAGVQTGALWLFGIDNMGTTITAPTVQNLTGLGSTFTITIPDQTIAVLTLTPEPGTLAIAGLGAAWLLARRRGGRWGLRVNRVQVISLSVEKGLLRRTDAAARKSRLSRAQFVAQALKFRLSSDRERRFSA